MEHNYKRYWFYANEREATEGEELEACEEDKWWVYTILYAAAGGTTVAMACAKKLGATVLLMMEQWRVQVFLLLNLLLLAIFLTSFRSSPAASIRQTRRQKQSTARGSESKPDPESQVIESRVAEKKKKEVAETEQCEKEEEKLTKEELNQRAEAFIAKFREHLVRDAAIEGRGVAFG